MSHIITPPLFGKLYELHPPVLALVGAKPAVARRPRSDSCGLNKPSAAAIRCLEFMLLPHPSSFRLRLSMLVSMPLPATSRGLKLAFLRASNVELPVPIPASTPTNKFLQLESQAQASLMLSIPNYLPSRQVKSLDYEWVCVFDRILQKYRKVRSY